jgi:two-component system sensor histidine kinase UhpB
MAIAIARASATAAPATPRIDAWSLDLKWSLTLRVVAVALLCFLVAAGLALYGTYRDLRQANENVADIVVRQLQVQLFRIDSDIDAPARFPDWDPVIDRVQNAGQCIQYVQTDGTIGRSSCVGANQSEGRPPAWFAALGNWMLAGHADITRPVAYHGKAYGTVVVATAPAVVLDAIWKDVSGLLGLTALLVVAICLLQYVAISRALRPTKDILGGLDRLSRGDLSCRLPGFRLIELRRISEVFNTLAASLERTTRERTALAARLVDGQEQERRHLARELHDELAQTLSAISAAAASIKTTAASQCPALVPEASDLAQTSLTMMRSLRCTLQSLRPPEIDDFGLAASLTALAKEQERRAEGKLKITLDVDGDLHELPPTAASHVYRIVQEGLTNIGKHADASRVRVALDLHAQQSDQEPSQRRWLTLSIEDDGCGAVDSGLAATGNGLGLIGMRERAMALGGQLDVIRLERGFKLQAVIPFAMPAEALS